MAFLSRRVLVAVLAGVLLLTAGCLLVGQSPNEASVPDPAISQLQVEQCPTAPQSAEESPLDARSAPDSPSDLNESSAISYTENFERFYAWNTELRENTTDISINVESSQVVNETRTGFIVNVEVGFSDTRNRSGTETVGSGFYTATYFINDSVVVRSEAAGEHDRGVDLQSGNQIRC